VSSVQLLEILVNVILDVLVDTLADDTFEFRLDDLLRCLRARVDDIVEESVHACVDK